MFICYSIFHKMKLNKERWMALDAFKTIAIFVMILWHLSLWWVNLNTSIDIEGKVLKVGVTQWPYLLQIIVAFSGHFVMSIPLIAGAAMRFYFEKYQNSKFKSKEFLKAIVVRAFALAMLGHLMNLLAFGADSWYFWNVLQLVSVSIIITAIFILFSSIYLLALAGFLVIFIAPLVRILLEKYNSYFALMLVGDKVGDNIWAFFPWYGIVVYGYALAHFYLKCKDSGKLKNFKILITLISFFLIIIALLKNQFFYWVDLRYPWSSSLFQPPTLTILAQISIFNILLFLFDWYFSKIRRIRKYGIINAFSRGILWVYLVHVIVGFRLIEFLLAKGYSNLFFLFLIIAFILLLCYFVGVIVIRKREKNINSSSRL